MYATLPSIFYQIFFQLYMLVEKGQHTFHQLNSKIIKKSRVFPLQIHFLVEPRHTLYAVIAIIDIKVNLITYMTAFYLLILNWFVYFLQLFLFDQFNSLHIFDAVFCTRNGMKLISLYIEQEILQCALIYLFTFTCFAFRADIDSLWVFFYQSLSTLLHLCASSQKRRSIDSSSSFMAI